MNVNKDTFLGPSFSLKNRLMRALWGLVWFWIFRFVPVPFHAIRSSILRLFGASIGRGVHVYPRVRIWAPWNLIVGDEAGIANDVIIYSQGKISIGRRVVISQGSHLCSGSHDYEKCGMPLFVKDISIGDFSWITSEVFVHPGVSIGEGAVIGARSVVTKDVPPWSVWAGHPCKPIKLREWRPKQV